MSLVRQAPQEEVDWRERQAKSALSRPAQQFPLILQGWMDGIREVWANDDPQGVITAMGTDAREAWFISAATAQYLEALEPGCTADGMAYVRPVTFDEEGRGTIDA
jgi:hypothetical protein